MALWLGLSAFTARAWVQSLVRKLRSLKLCSVAKKEKYGTDIEWEIVKSISKTLLFIIIYLLLF